MVKKFVAMAFAAALSLNVNVKAVEKDETKEVEKEVASLVLSLKEKGATDEEIVEKLVEAVSKDMPAMSKKKKRLIVTAVVAGALTATCIALWKLEKFPFNKTEKTDSDNKKDQKGDSTKNCHSCCSSKNNQNKEPGVEKNPVEKDEIKTV